MTTRPEDAGLDLCPTCHERPASCLCDMRLPVGCVCSDCLNWRRCHALIASLNPDSHRCDFSPSRFIGRVGS